jgi:uncharacterized damage-inducible protein DinB
MKEDQVRYLQRGRDVLLWKLDGLSEYDARRPMVRTGTNLLGLVKHMAGVEAGYFGRVFNRPLIDPVPWDTDDAEENSDMWATPDESRDYIIDTYRSVWAHADATIDTLDLDSPGVVPWWPDDRRNVTLDLILSHVVAEVNRHAGHADILRELIDGGIGFRPEAINLTEEFDWDGHRDRLEQAARAAD